MSADDDSLTLPRKAKPSRAYRIGIVGPSVVVALAFALWSGYWAFVAHQVEWRLLNEQKALIKAGYQASSEPFTVSGYPYRMYVDLKNVVVISPSGKGVTAPEVVAEANAYALTKWIISAPQGLTVFRGHPDGNDLGKLTVTGRVLHASVSHLDQPIRQVSIQGTDIVLTPSDPAHPFVFSRADTFEAYTRPTPNQPDTVDWVLRVDGAHGAPKSLVGDLSPNQALTLRSEGTISHMSAFKGDVTTGLSAWAAAGGQIRGFHTLLQAGDLSVDATSPMLTADADNRVAGHLDIALSGTYKPIDILAASRLISPDNLILAKPLLDMTLSTGNNQKFGVDFKNGGSYIGVLKVSDAPILP